MNRDVFADRVVDWFNCSGFLRGIMGYGILIMAQIPAAANAIMGPRACMRKALENATDFFYRY